MRRVALRALGVVALITMVGCGKEELSAPRMAGSAASAHSAVSYVITTDDDVPVDARYGIAVGLTTQLELRAVRVAGNPDRPQQIYTDLPGAKWVSGSPAVATVSGNGLLTAVTPGYTVVTASLGSKSVSITVRAFDLNRRPTPDFSFACVGLTCTFTDETLDPGNVLTGWTWKFGDGGTSGVTSDDPNPTHTYGAAGTYTVELAVLDIGAGSTTVSKSVTVPASSNQSPVADFTWSCSGLTCTFTDASGDPDGRVVGWRWDFGDGTTSTSQSASFTGKSTAGGLFVQGASQSEDAGTSSAQNPTHTYSASGTYTVVLTAVDNEDAAATASKRLAALPKPRSDLAGATVNGLVYAFGGGDADEQSVTTVEAYDPVRNAWTARAAMPTSRKYLAGTAVNGVIYAVGGYTYLYRDEYEMASISELLNTVEAYDPMTDTWTAKAPLQGRPRYGLAVAGVNGVMYAVGGHAGDGGGNLGTVEAYDPVTNTWTARAPMPTPRYLLGVAAAHGMIYAIGGYDNGGYDIGTVEAYDPLTDTWTTRAPMPTPRAAAGVAEVNGLIYVVGGSSSRSPVPGGHVRTVEAYDPVTDTWTTKAAMPTPRYGFALAEANGVLYAVGGWADPSFDPDGVSVFVEAYDPVTDTWR